MSADRNLLFGILALQLNFVTRDQLVEGMHAWVLDKTKSIGQIFIANKAMDAEQLKLLDALVDKHVEKHGGDVQQSIQQLSSFDPHATQQLMEIEDYDLQKTVGIISAQTIDPHATQPFQQAPKRSASRFKIIRPYARGGLGEVFVAQDTELSRQVALKEIQDRFADNIDSRERFLREAEITGRLEHPGIVPVYGLGTYDDGRPFYAMKFVKGDSLKEAIDNFHSDPNTKAAKSFTTGTVGIKFRELLGRFIDVCNAVHYAHSRGILHRDLKPGNIMIGEYGETLVVDWGLAKVLGERAVEGSNASIIEPAGGSGSAPTLQGIAVGTPAYMSPEQASGKVDELGPATDVYSLGATLFYLFTGDIAFHSADPDGLALIKRVQLGDFGKPRQLNPRIPVSLEAVCLKAMSSQPSNRYSGTVELANEITRWLADEPVQVIKETITDRTGRFFRRHRSWAYSGGIALAVVAVIATLSAFQTTAQNRAIRLQSHLAERHLYFARMKIAQSAWQSGNAAETRNQLDFYAQTENAEKDHRGFEWYYMNELMNGSITAFEMPWFRDAQISSDGETVAISSGTHLLLFNTLTRKKIFEIELQGSLKDLSIADSGGLVAGIVMWDKSDKSDIANKEEPQTQSVCVWDASGKNVLTLDLGRFESPYAKLDPDGIALVVQRSSVLEVFDARTGESIKELPLRSRTFDLDRNASALCVSPDHKRQVNQRRDGSIFIADISSGKIQYELDHLDSAPRLVRWSFDGRKIATLDSRQIIRVWDAGSGKLLTLRKGNTSEVVNLAFSRDLTRLVTANLHLEIGFQDLTRDQESRLLASEHDQIFGVTWSRDGRMIATSEFAYVHVWDAVTGECINALKAREVAFCCAVFGRDDEWLATTDFGDEGGSVHIWNLKSGERSRTLTGLKTSVRDLAVSFDCNYLIALDENGTVVVWNTLSWECIGKIDTTGQKLAAHPQKYAFAVVSRDQGIKVFDLKTTAQLSAISAVTGNGFLQFSPTGQYLLSASGDSMSLYNIASGKLERSYKGHRTLVNCVSFTQDGTRILSGDNDGVIKIWDTETGLEVMSLAGHSEAVLSMAVNHKGDRLVSCGDEGSIRIWDASPHLDSTTLRNAK